MGDCKTLFVVFCCFIVLVILTPSSQHGFNHFPQEAPALYETRCISEPYKFPRFAADHTRKTDEPCSEDFANSKATDLIDNLTVWRNCRTPTYYGLDPAAKNCPRPKIGFICSPHKVWTCDQWLTSHRAVNCPTLFKKPRSRLQKTMKTCILPPRLRTRALVGRREANEHMSKREKCSWMFQTDWWCRGQSWRWESTAEEATKCR